MAASDGEEFGFIIMKVLTSRAKRAMFFGFLIGF